MATQDSYDPNQKKISLNKYLNVPKLTYVEIPLPHEASQKNF